MRVSIVVLMLGVCCVSAARAEERDPHSTWNLAQNVLLTSNQISFSQGSNDVWYFLERRSLLHDQILYFIVHPKAEISCDSTRLQLIITRGDGD